MFLLACFDLKTQDRYPQDEILFFDVYFPYKRNIARNANPGSFHEYRIFRGIPVTGLIRVFLILFFLITDYPAPNPKQEILREEKLAFLFPNGWQIAYEMPHSR